MSTENEKNPIVNGKELADEAVEQATGGWGGMVDYAIILGQVTPAPTAVAPAPAAVAAPAVDAGVAAAATAIDAGVAAVANAATVSEIKPDRVSDGECLVTFTSL